MRSLGRVPDAVSGLVALLDMSPTDAEAWSELSDVYLSQGLYPQSIYALEEVLVLVPNAWNVSVTPCPVQPAWAADRNDFAGWKARPCTKSKLG